MNRKTFVFFDPVQYQRNFGIILFGGAQCILCPTDRVDQNLLFSLIIDGNFIPIEPPFRPNQGEKPEIIVEIEMNGREFLDEMAIRFWLNGF